MRILIAEDDTTTRMVLERKLSEWGYDTIVATDGAQALRAIVDQAPSLAVLDWMMPEMDGVEVCREIRKLEVKEPVYLILLTARGGKQDIVAGLEAGADDYIAKPFDNEELRARLGVGSRVITLERTLRRRIAELQDALAHIHTLQGILPVCSHCHRIRTDKESWERIEKYIAEHSEARLSHTLCPDCIEKHYPDYAVRRRERLAGNKAKEA